MDRNNVPEQNTGKLREVYMQKRQNHGRFQWFDQLSGEQDGAVLGLYGSALVAGGALELRGCLEQTRKVPLPMATSSSIPLWSSGEVG